MPNVLPLELQEYILEHLCGDRRALVSCLVVCKAWVPRVRHLLSSSIQFNWNERSRTWSLFQALAGTRTHVRELTITKPGDLKPEELVKLLEALENLQLLSIRTREGNFPTPINRLVPDVFRNAALAERMLLAVANMPQLRELDFGPDYLLPVPRPVVASDFRLYLAPGLRQLRSVRGDMFPSPYIHRLWDAIVARKAQPGAPPLLHLATKIGPNEKSLCALGRLLVGVGQHLQSLSLDFTRVIPQYDVHLPGRYRLSNMSLQACSSLRTLKFRMSDRVHSQGAFTIASALLFSVPQDAPLENLAVSISQLLSRDIEAHPQLQAHLAIFNESIASLRDLKRVEWRLEFVDQGDTSLFVSGLTKHIPALAERRDIVQTWDIIGRI